MNRPIVVLGAPSSIGIRPYDDGTMRRLDLAPGVLREEGIVERDGMPMPVSWTSNVTRFAPSRTHRRKPRLDG